MFRRHLLLAAPGLAAAQSYPERPLRILVTAPPGGGGDVVGRLLAESFAERLGQRVLVENRPGAGGTLAAEAAARAVPDGHTLFIGIVSTQVLIPAIRRVAYDAERGFAPIGLISQAPMVLLVHPSVPARDVAGLLAYARSRIGGVSVSNGGVATLPHLLHEMFARQTGLVGQAVPYSGSATALAAVVNGEVQASFEVAVIVRPQHVAGTVRALAVTTAERDPTLPEVPTMAEAGFPGVRASSWLALFAPAGTPAPVIARLNEVLVATLGADAFRARLAQFGSMAVPGSPEALADFVVAERERWGDVVRSAGSAFQ